MNSESSAHTMISSLFHAMNTRNFSDLEKQVTDDVAFDFPGAGRIEGARRVLIFLKALLRKYESLVFSVNDILLDGNKACAIWENEGVHVDGHDYANSGVTLIHITDSKISFISDYFKDTSFVQK